MTIPTIALGGTGGGLVVLYFLRDLAKDAWNDYRRGKMLRAQAAAVREGQPAKSGDIGAMLAHDLIAVINRDLDAMRAKADQEQQREDKRYSVVEALAAKLGEQTDAIKRLAETVANQTDQLRMQGNTLSIMAARR